MSRQNYFNDNDDQDESIEPWHLLDEISCYKSEHALSWQVGSNTSSSVPFQKALIQGLTVALISDGAFTEVNGNEYDEGVVLSDGSIIALPSPVDGDGMDRYRDRYYYRLSLKERRETKISRSTFSSSSGMESLVLGRDIISLYRTSLASFDDDKGNYMRMSSPVATPLTPRLQNIKYSNREYFLNMLPSFISPLSISSIKMDRLEKILSYIMTLSSSLYSGSSCSFGALLLTGKTGSGKTHTALSLAAKLRTTQNRASLYLDCRHLQKTSMSMGKIMEELSCIFRLTMCCRASVLILDNLDELLPNTTSESDKDTLGQQTRIDLTLANQVKVLSDHFVYLVDGLKSSCTASKKFNTDCILLCTCRDKNDLHSSLLCSNNEIFFEQNVATVATLSASQRPLLFMDMLGRILLPCGMHINDDDNGNREDKDYKIGHDQQRHEALLRIRTLVKNRTEGYCHRDLMVLATRLLTLHRNRRLSQVLVGDESQTQNLNYNVNTLERDINAVLSSYTPLHRQSFSPTHEYDTSKNCKLPKWSSIGGLYRTKRILTQSILRPIKYRSIYENSPVSLPRGLLLYGPPGCGKTHIISALTAECSNFQLVMCRGPELLDKYIGASEANVRRLFEKAYASAPSILFLDEFEALAPRRGSGHTGVTGVVNQLLTFLDGVEDRSGGDNDIKGGERLVYIVAASSRPDKIDPALLRPGRLETHVYVGFPESTEERNDLFEKIALGKNVTISTSTIISHLTAVELASYNKLSAADMRAVLDSAHLLAVHEYLDKRSLWETTSVTTNTDVLLTSSSVIEDEPRVSIKMIHLLKALSTCRVSLSDEDRIAFAKAYIPFLAGSSSKITVENNHGASEYAARLGLTEYNVALLFQSPSPPKMALK